MPIRATLLAAAALICGLSAQAETPPACPAEAAQILINIQYAALTGQMTNSKDIYDNAVLAHRLCPDDPDVQGLSAQLFGLLGQGIEDPELKTALFGHAYTAAIQQDHVFHNGTGTEVTLPDGTRKKIYPFSDTWNLLEKTAFPALMDLLNQGQSSPIYQDAPMEACPYQRNYSRGMEYEVRAIRERMPSQLSKPDTVAAISGRLTRLREACPDQAGYLSHALAFLHNRAVYGMLASEPAEARENARRALAYAAEYGRSDPDTRGAYPAADADWLTRMRNELLNRYPDLAGG
ncbi:hypothetical protein [Hyphomonas sp.]|uniref:hypothetical protein n=1 Tax=Hyphomonas sp. TaxID=87 RepID=UPI0039191DAB